MMLLVATLATAAALSQNRGYGATSGATKGVVSGLTRLVNLNGGETPNAVARQRKVESLTPQEVRDGLAEDYRNEYLWSGKITPELYDERCVFTDPTLSFAGLDVFESNLKNLDPWIERFVPAPQRRVDLYSLKQTGTTVTASWRMVGALKLPWRPRLDLNGTTTYTLGGAGGRISAYDETWAITAGDALLQLLKPAPIEVVEPEFWPGRSEGRAPVSKVRAPILNPPTIVVLPGFGNDASDYATPLGLPAETGLVSALERRGFKVEVVPVARGDWLQVLTKGYKDLDFLLFEKASMNSPSFSWYAAKVSETVATIEGPVLLVGHSAGGWLAKLSCLLDDEVAKKVAGVVTLGAPHLPPPAGTPCATRGVVADVARAAWPAVPLITVASASIRGDAAGGVEAKTAADAYRRVSGDGSDVGDSVVPLCAAHLPEADLQLTLPCRHSINVAGTSAPTDEWYGAERWVDAWLGPALGIVSKPRWLRGLGR